MSVEEAVISEWMVGVGESITKGDEVVTVETDKAQSTIPSPYSGKIAEILVHDGEVAAVGALIAVIES
jgi:pyruvate/2-oxoglutarate dehydrogenase complex dihydrolipoamide acyltransferase (E2) component